MGICEVCSAETRPYWEGKLAGPRTYRFVCPPCRIAETACSRIHGIESELREKYTLWHKKRVDIYAIKTQYNAYLNNVIDASQFRATTGLSVRGIVKQIALLEQTSKQELEQFANFQLDPLGLDRLSDDRDFIEKFLRGENE